MSNESDFCPLDELIARIGGRWKVIVLWNLAEGRLRFGELRRRMPTVSAKIMTAQLRELERDGLVTRQVFAEVPPRVEYALTPLAMALTPLLRSMHAWSQAHLSPQAPRRRRGPRRAAEPVAATRPGRRRSRS